MIDAGTRFRIENGFEDAAYIELDNERWQFYELFVWKREDGYYMATDSGCSCPTPFENHATWDDYTGPLTAEQVREEAESIILLARPEAEGGYPEGPRDEDVVDFLSKFDAR